MPNYKYLGFLFMSIALLGCSRSIEDKDQRPPVQELVKAVKKLDLTTYEWLTGTWEGESKEGNFVTEKWSFKNEDLEGASLTISGNDTLLNEILTIEHLDNELYYNVDIESLKKAVSFKLIEHNRNRLLFENKENDFPKRILYVFQKPDNLAIKLTGKENGERKKVNLFYKKVN